VNDVALATKLEKKHAEKAEIVSKVGECQERLAQKKVPISSGSNRGEFGARLSLLRLTAPPLLPQVEIERLLEKDRAIMGEFNTAIGDGNKFQELLLKIFKKKVTRQQTRLGHAPNPTRSQPTSPSTGEAAAQGARGR